jgi:alpha-L-rhamnosidase
MLSIFGLLPIALSSAAAAPLAAYNLRTFFLTDPPLIHLDSYAPPSFSWLPLSEDRGAVQSAYEVSVYSPTGSLFWSSGRVISPSTSSVAYSGPPLAPDTTYSWAVTWVDGAGATAPPSANATFGTAPGDSAAWAAAGSQWIGCPSAPQNQLRVEFPLSPPSAGATIGSARLYISGLGWHRAYLNGERLGRAVLDPAFTNLRVRVYYSAHEVGHLLSTGGAGNALAVMLGGGWPDVLSPWGPNSGKGVPPWNGSTAAAAVGATAGPTKADMLALSQEDLAALIAAGYGHGHTGYEKRLRAWLSVTWSDGTKTSIVSQAPNMGSSAAAAAAAPAPNTWQCSTGALLSADLYGGCTIDARAETSGWLSPQYNYTSGAWGAAVRKAEPGGAMVPAVFPGVEVVAELTPIALWEAEPGSYVWDMGQNFAGGVRLSLPGPTAPGVTIVVRHAEAVLHPPYGPQNGSLYFGNLRSAEATDTFTTRGSTSGETFEPLFTWHGFRYVHVSGLPLPPTQEGVVTGLNYRTAVATTGSLTFPASANTLNQLQHAIQWGQASNLMGNPSDCPQRDERLGWTGDSALSSEECALNYDVAAFLAHWADTIDDSLTLNAADPTFKEGGLPETIPDITGGYDADASWSSVWPSTLHTLWKAYGDAAPAARYWPDLMAYVNHTVGGMKGGNIQGVFSTWGDWCPPPEALGGGQGPKPSPAFTAGVSFLDDLAHILEMGAALEAPEVPALQALQARLAAQFNAAWAHGSYYGSSPTDGAQTAQAAALALGIVPPSARPGVVDYLVQDIAAHGGHLSVGIIGQKYLTRALTASGNAWLAANISLQTDYPSFGWTFNHRACDACVAVWLCDP